METSLDFTVYGVAGTTVAILLYFIRNLWLDNKELRNNSAEVMKLALEKVTAIVTSSTNQLQENGKVLLGATDVIRIFSERPVATPEEIYEIKTLLRELKERRFP